MCTPLSFPPLRMCVNKKDKSFQSELKPDLAWIWPFEMRRSVYKALWDSPKTTPLYAAAAAGELLHRKDIKERNIKRLKLWRFYVRVLYLCLFDFT